MKTAPQYATMQLRDVFPAISSLFGPRKEAASTLPVIPPPKGPNKQQTQASFSKRTKTTTGDQRLIQSDRQTANLDLLTLRNGTTTKATIHDLAQVSPDLSASVWAYQRLVVSKDFTAVARNQDGTANPQATTALQQVLARMNYLTDYAQGFNNISGVHAVAESLAKELRLYGSCAMELVLDKARLPSRLQPISSTQIVFFEAKDGTTFPQQQISGNYIDLDTPAFFYESLDQDLLSAYSDSPMEAALAATLSDAEFTQDVRRVIKRSLHPRLDAQIDSDQYRKSIPMELHGDAEALRAYQNNYINAIEDTVNGLEPDDALVHFDALKFAYLNNGNVTLNKEYEVLGKMIDAKLATGTKAPPSVLGHGSGSANIASTETMLFLRYVEGVQLKVNSIMSRALTLALRLMGEDVYVQFEFARVDIRPDAELEAFKAMKQSRILDQLSMGLISDEEASIALTGKLPPPGYKPLSGTFFKAGMTDPNAVDTAAAQSNTGAVQQDLKPDTPQAPKGPAQNAPKNTPKAEVETLPEITKLEEKTAALEGQFRDLGLRHAVLGAQHEALEKQAHIVATRRADHEPLLRVVSDLVMNLQNQEKPEPMPLNVHVHMPEGLVRMEPSPTNVQVDVHVPEAAAPAPSKVQVDVHVPQAPAPQVSIVNEVQPSDVTVHNMHPAKAIQTVERDSNDEITRTVTTYEV